MSSAPLAFTWAYALSWNAGWLLLVWQAGQGGDWLWTGLGVGVPLLVIGWRLGRRSWRPLVAALAGYLLVDALALAATGTISYEGRLLWSALPPLWILGLWLWLLGGVQLLLPDWLRRPGPLAGLGLTAPLAYWGGQQLAAVQLGHGATVSLLVVAVAYALVLPLVTRLLPTPPPRDRRDQQTGRLANA